VNNGPGLSSLRPIPLALAYLKLTLKKLATTIRQVEKMSDKKPAQVGAKYTEPEYRKVVGDFFYTLGKLTRERGEKVTQREALIEAMQDFNNKYKD
jgi:hypothetical protein